MDLPWKIVVSFGPSSVLAFFSFEPEASLDSSYALSSSYKIK